MVHKMLWLQGEGKSMVANAINRGFMGHSSIINRKLKMEHTEESLKDLAFRIIDQLYCIVVDYDGIDKDMIELIDVLEEELKDRKDKFLLIFKAPEIQDLHEERERMDLMIHNKCGGLMTFHGLSESDLISYGCITCEHRACSENNECVSCDDFSNWNAHSLIRVAK